MRQYSEKSFEPRVVSAGRHGVPTVADRLRHMLYGPVHLPGDVGYDDQRRPAAGPALVDGFWPMSFADTAVGGTAPRHLDLFDALPDPLIDVLVKAGERADLPVSTVEIRH